MHSFLGNPRLTSRLGKSRSFLIGHGHRNTTFGGHRLSKYTAYIILFTPAPAPLTVDEPPVGYRYLPRHCWAGHSSRASLRQRSVCASCGPLSSSQRQGRTSAHVAFKGGCLVRAWTIWPSQRSVCCGAHFMSISFSCSLVGLNR